MINYFKQSKLITSMGSDSVDELKKYIKSSRKKGYSVEIIEESLEDAGFDSSNISKAFEELKIKRPGIFSRTIFRSSKPEIKKSEKIEPPKKPRTKPGKPKKSFLQKIFRPAEPKKRIPEKIELPKKPKPEPVKPKKSFFKHLFKQKKAAPAKKEKPPVTRPKRKPLRMIHITVFSVLILLVLAIAITLIASPATCATKECFLEKANACEKATYKNAIAGARINYESRTDCTIVKTLVKVADTEPAEIKEKFQGKSMICAYYKNDFSPMHIETVSGLVVNCEGPLKQAIIQYIT